MDDLMQKLLGGLGTALGGSERLLSCCVCERFARPHESWVSATKKRVVCDVCIESLFEDDEELPWEAERRDSFSDCWNVLGLDPDEATTEDVNRRFRELAPEFHPDKHGGDDAAMKALNRARADALEELRG